MLVRGPSGSGKSDLALQALHVGWRLVADDRVRVWRSGGRVFGQAPALLHGLVEARGQAILRLPALRLAPIDLVADLVPPGAQIERLPTPGFAEIAGAELPRIVLRLGEASAPARLAFALEADRTPAATAPL